MALVLLLVGSVVLLLLPAKAEFIMEGRWFVKERPSGGLCPVVALESRQWTFTLPAEAVNGHETVQRTLGAAQCLGQGCTVQHSLDVHVVEWRERAGFFSGYSELTVDAVLVRTGAGCTDRAVARGLLKIEQGRRGDPDLITDAMGRWALEYFQAAYEHLYSPEI